MVTITLDLFLTFLVLKTVSANSPIIELEDGKIQGVTQKTDTGKTYHAFKQIPYAKPPIGDLRFAEAVPPQGWTEVLDATRNTRICMQKRLVSEDQTPDPREDEDCLYVNVYTPTISNASLLPVYVYIYGGMHLVGDPTEYDFQGFIDEDIVAVIISYRVASLGHLSTSDGVIPANLWLKDQTLGLKWVNKNIRNFGGDPEKVTIGGHSSGSFSVGYHVLNTKSKGLFRAAIMQSGSPLEGGLISNATEAAYTFSQSFDPNVTSKSTEELLSYLRGLPADVVTRADNTHRPAWMYSAFLHPRPAWGPVIEKPSEEAVITGPMHDNIKNGVMNRVPILIGITSEEALVLYLDKCQKVIDANLTRLVPTDLNVKQENVLKLATKIKNIYTTTSTFKQNMTGLVQMASDLMYTLPVITQARLHSKYNDVYFYQFSYKGPMNGLKEWRKSRKSRIEGVGKAEHCDELPFLYNYRPRPSVDEDLDMRRKMLKLWTNFIKEMNPTPNPDPLLENIAWPKVKTDDYKYLDINLKMSVKSNPRRVKEWDEKLEKYFEQPRNIY